MAVRKIIHIIDTLGVGGAETLLVNTVNALEDIEHVVLYLSLPDTLATSFNKNVKVICLKHKRGVKSIRTIFRIRNVVNAERPDIVHVHLLWPMIYTRLALPTGVKLISTIHTPLSIDGYIHNPLIKQLDKYTYKKEETIIAVSRSVLEDYDREIGIKGDAEVLHNFVNPIFFQRKWHPRNILLRPIKLVAVGNLRAAKNHEFILQAMTQLPKKMISLDIYGAGDLEQQLRLVVDKYDLDVAFKGKVQNIHDVLLEYDAYIMSSTLEGHSIAVAEAMAVGIPMLLSKIPTLEEGSFGYASFFELRDASGLVALLGSFEEEYDNMVKRASKAQAIARENYQKDVYISRLLNAYNRVCIAAG